MIDRLIFGKYTWREFKDLLFGDWRDNNYILNTMIEASQSLPEDPWYFTGKSLYILIVMELEKYRDSLIGEKEIRSRYHDVRECLNVLYCYYSRIDLEDWIKGYYKHLGNQGFQGASGEKAKNKYKEYHKNLVLNLSLPKYITKKIIYPGDLRFSRDIGMKYGRRIDLWIVPKFRDLYTEGEELITEEKFYKHIKHKKPLNEYIKCGDKILDESEITLYL